MKQDDIIPDLVKKHGWAVVTVEADVSAPPFGYTVGLYETFGHAEIILFGLGEDATHGVLNSVGQQVRKGVVFVQSGTYDGILEGFPCAFRDVLPAAAAHYLGRATAYYGDAIPVLQCYWPDRHGHFPWDPGAEAGFRGLQPKLGTDEAAATIRRPAS